jgi:hypothetical protein
MSHFIHYNAECHHALNVIILIDIMLSDIMLSDIMLSDIMLGDIILSDIVLNVVAPLRWQLKYLPANMELVFVKNEHSSILLSSVTQTNT